VLPTLDFVIAFLTMVTFYTILYFRPFPLESFCSRHNLLLNSLHLLLFKYGGVLIDALYVSYKCPYDCQVHYKPGGKSKKEIVKHREKKPERYKKGLGVLKMGHGVFRNSSLL
jgi:hypothetical protein